MIYINVYMCIYIYQCMYIYIYIVMLHCSSCANKHLVFSQLGALVVLKIGLSQLESHFRN